MKNSHNRVRVRLLVVGCGRHASRAYMPPIAAGMGELVGIVDVAPVSTSVLKLLGENGIWPRLIQLDSWTGSTVPSAQKRLLDDLLHELQPDAVIISTPPEYHYPYLIWALNAGLHCLVDKPIVCADNASTDPQVVDCLRDEHYGLEDLDRSRPDVLCSIAVQRRFNPIFDRAREWSDEISRTTGLPITHISSYHGDGSFRLPNEIRAIDNHGTRRGQGKLFHSGYHLFDYQADLITSAIAATGRDPITLFDELRVVAQTTRPAGFVKMVSPAVLANSKFRGVPPQLNEVSRAAAMEYGGHGELDVTCLSGWYHHGDATITSVIDLHHNSFSRRADAVLSHDLYKGVGRVKHERHEVLHGPFSTIILEHRESRPVHATNGAESFRSFGDNHYRVIQYRNVELLGIDGEAYRSLDIEHCAREHNFDGSCRWTEYSKQVMFAEFVDSVAGNVRISEARSSLASHSFGMNWFLTAAEAVASQKRASTFAIPAIGGMK